MGDDIEFGKEGFTIKIGWLTLLKWLAAHWAWIATWVILIGHMAMTATSQKQQDREIKDLQTIIACMADEGCRKK